MCQTSYCIVVVPLLFCVAKKLKVDSGRRMDKAGRRGRPWVQKRGGEKERTVSASRAPREPGLGCRELRLGWESPARKGKVGSLRVLPVIYTTTQTGQVGTLLGTLEKGYIHLRARSGY